MILRHDGKSALAIALLLIMLLSVSPALVLEPAKADIKYLTLVPKEDTWIFQGEPNTIEGVADMPDLQFGKYKGYGVEAWLKFNLTSLNIPLGYAIKSATLRLYNTGTGQTPKKGLIQIWKIVNDWTEKTLTWNNKPSDAYLVNYTNCGFTGSYWAAASGYCRLVLNETDVQKSYSTLSRIHSVALRAPSQAAQTGVLIGYSKENAPSNRPELDVTIAPEGTSGNAQLAVIVDRSDVAYYENYQRGVGKYLEWWKMDYQEIDISVTQLTTTLLNSYRAVIIPQFDTTRNGHLTLAELQAINQTVYENGVGVVQIDASLHGYAGVWEAYPRLFGITIQGWVTTTARMNLAIVNNTHFITSIYRNGTQMNAIQNTAPYQYESNLVFLNTTVGPTATTLAVMPYYAKPYPALVVNTVGKGKVVLSTFSTGRVALDMGYDGFGEAPLKTTSGMHGLLWRSIVYAAKKPFVFGGMPPFQTFRVDDAGESDAATMRSYISEFVKNGIFVNLYPVVVGVNAHLGASQVLKDFYWNGSAHIGAYSWTTEDHIFWNAQGAGSEYSTSTLTKYLNWLDGNFSRWNITASQVIVPHSSWLGANAVPFLQNRGWTVITGNWLKVPPTSGTMTGWLWDGDFDRPNLADDYADANNKIRSVYFNFIVANGPGLRGDIFQEPSTPVDVAKATSYWMSQSEHALADLFPSMPFGHEPDITTFLPSGNLGKVLTYATRNVTALYPMIIPASMEYIAYYTINREGLALSNYDYTGNALTLDLTGTSKMATALYVFSDEKVSSYDGILDAYQSYGTNGYLVWVPPFSGEKQVSLTFGSSESANPHIHYAPFNVTSTTRTAGQLIVEAYPVTVHTKPKYPMIIDAADQGQPQSVTVGGVSKPFVYDSTTRFVSLEVMFGPDSSSTEIVVSWTPQVDTQPPLYSRVGYNTTLASSSCLFYSLWQDNGGLSGYIFSSNNTGVWTNDTWTSLVGRLAWANVTKTLTSEGDRVVGYRWYCSDTSGNWNDTGVLALTTALGDVKPPTYNFIQTNSTVASNPCRFSSYWQDQGGLSGYVFSTNYTGTWRNDTFARFTGTAGWANVTKTLNGKIGSRIEYRWYCADLSGNWNDTGAQILVTTYSAKPQYSNIGYTATQENSPCTFSSLWTDDQALSGYIFGTNVTGVWTNDTWSPLPGIQAWANKTRTLPNSVGARVAFQWWCNDSQNQWTTTGPQSLITTMGPPPKYSNIAYSTTVAGSPAMFSCRWQDASGLSGFIFSTNNTGVWRNDTWTALSGVSAWANVTKVLNSTVGTVVGFRWYCNDTNSIWNSTNVRFLTTTSLVQSAVFGKTSIGASTNTAPISYVVAFRFQAPENGTATLISAYIHGRYQAGLVKAMIYSDVSGSPNTLLFESAEVTLSASWAWHNFTVNYNLEAGKYYWFAVYASTNMEFRYAAGVTKQMAYSWGWTYPTVPTTFNGVYGPSYTNWIASVYVTYTPSKP